TDRPTVIEYDDHEYLFEGFSVYSHTPLTNIPLCRVIRFNIDYTIHFIEEMTPENYCVRGLELFASYLFQDVLELYDWNLTGPDFEVAGCQRFHFMPRFVRFLPDGGKEVLSMHQVLLYLLRSSKPLVPEEEIADMLQWEELAWQKYAEECKGMIVTNPGMVRPRPHCYDRRLPCLLFQGQSSPPPNPDTAGLRLFLFACEPRLEPSVAQLIAPYATTPVLRSRKTPDRLTVNWGPAEDMLLSISSLICEVSSPPLTSLYHSYEQNPGLKPSSVRIDQLDREQFNPDVITFPVIVHFGIRPAQLSYAGDPQYQKLWKSYVKLRHLLANSPKVKQIDKQKLTQREEALQKIRQKNTMRREVTVELSSQGFWKTGIRSDVCQSSEQVRSSRHDQGLALLIGCLTRPGDCVTAALVTARGLRGNAARSPPPAALIKTCMAPSSLMWWHGVNHAMMLPVLTHHIRYHQCLMHLDELIGYVFKERCLLQLAMTHPSHHLNFGMNPDHARNSLSNCGIRQPKYGDRKVHHMYMRKKGINTLINIMSRLGQDDPSPSRINHNERLEFLGDAVVEFLTSVHLYYLFPGLEEGGLATYRTAIVQNQHLAMLAKKLELDRFMLYAHGPDLCRESDLRHAMANCFEALIVQPCLRSPDDRYGKWVALKRDRPPPAPKQQCVGKVLTGPAAPKLVTGSLSAEIEPPCYWSRAFSPHNTNLHRSHGKMMRGAHKRCHVILAHASLSDKDINHRFPKSSRRHINRHALADVSLPCCLKLVSRGNICYVEASRIEVHIMYLTQFTIKLCFVLGAVYLEGGLEESRQLFGRLLFNTQGLQEVWLNYPAHPLQVQEPLTDRQLIETSPVLQKLTNFEDCIGILFTHVRLLARAFTLRTVGFNHLTLGHNQRMEFLGDSIMQLVATEYLFIHFPDHHEGHLTLLRSSLVNNRTQAKVAEELGMQDFAITNDKTKRPVALRTKTLADLLESFIAALYIDKDLEYVHTFMNVCFFPRLKEFILNQDWNDPKSQLQQCCLTLRTEGKEPDIPLYKTLQTVGPSHARTYTVAVYFKGERIGCGKGPR
ncbi:hypothetical protein JOQ06_017923, partial [Pogonophryne albipinna]